MIIPNMGTARKGRSGLAQALFTPVQARVLGLLFGQPDRRFQNAEIIRLVGGGTGAVHRQLERLAAAELVTVTRTGNQKYYQARRESPVFKELRGLAVKTVGAIEPLRQSLAGVRGRISAAFVFGSVAKGTDKAGSDIDLMVVSDTLRYPDLYPLLEGAESVLSRRVNATVLTATEWRAKRGRPNSFVARIAGQPRLFVAGSDDELV
jgi:predicted nucleotidyltransferase